MGHKLTDLTSIPLFAGLSSDGIDLILAADRILSIARCAALLITQGPNGMTLFRPDATPVHSAALARKVLDDKMSDRKAIKQLVKDWQADYVRA